MRLVHGSQTRDASTCKRGDGTTTFSEDTLF